MKYLISLKSIAMFILVAHLLCWRAEVVGVHTYTRSFLAFLMCVSAGIWLFRSLSKIYIYRFKTKQKKTTEMQVLFSVAAILYGITAGPIMRLMLSADKQAYLNAGVTEGSEMWYITATALFVSIMFYQKLQLQELSLESKVPKNLEEQSVLHARMVKALKKGIQNGSFHSRRNG
jgi:hypothetical protein